MGRGLGELTAGAGVLLAPMSGVTDAPFRTIARELGAAYVVSEMVASAGICTQQAEMVMKARDAGIRPNVVQLAGRDPGLMAEATRIVRSQGADIVDINMGCPAKKVTQGFAGSALMRELDLAERIIEAVIAASDGAPVTLKMRLGWDHQSLNAAELAERAEACGIRMITVHGRTRCQFYKGQADWLAVRDVVDTVAVPVIVNGDIGSGQDARTALERSGAQGVMIGRAAYGKPWIISQIEQILHLKNEVLCVNDAMVLHLAQRHYLLMLQHYDRHAAIRIARKHLGWYLDTLADRHPDMNIVRQEMLRADSADRVLWLLDNLAASIQTTSCASVQVAA